MVSPAEEPRLVKTEKGSSVFYRNTYLYSRYNPAQSIIAQIKKTSFSDHSLIILADPVLDYGITEIFSKLSDNSFVWCIFADPALYSFSRRLNALAAVIEHPHAKISLLQNTEQFFNAFLQLDSEYHFKQIPLIKSASTAASVESEKKFFNAVLIMAMEHCKAKAVNRLTLIQMGHRASANLFQNAKYFANNFNDDVRSPAKRKIFFIDNLTISRPIIILGGGPSATEIISLISRNIDFFKNNFFVIALDAIFAQLDFQPDAVAVLEPQIFITKAFVGVQKQSDTLLIADLASSPQVLKNWNGDICLTVTEYSQAEFLREFTDALEIKPFDSVGSVGLTAIQAALKIRQNENVPIYVCGLDFAYTQPFTHSIYSFQVKNIHNVTNIFNGAFLPENFFGGSILKIKTSPTTKAKGKTIYTTKNLMQYDRLFENFFLSQKNFYFAQSLFREGGLQFDTYVDLAVKYNSSFTNTKFSIRRPLLLGRIPIQKYLMQKKEQLQKIKLSLTGDTPLPDDELISLLRQNDFLFLHFPDNVKTNDADLLALNFLKRVRIELEYFLKILSER